MNDKNKNKVWIDKPVRYKDRKCSSGVTFGGEYVSRPKGERYVKKHNELH